MSDDAPHYYLDENLSPYIVAGLQNLQFRIESVPKRTPDSLIISEIGRRHGRLGVWISCDKRAKTRHKEDILDAGISVAWIRVRKAHADTQCFLVCSFMYGYRNVIASSDEALYFSVAERETNGIFTAVVDRLAL